MNNRPVSVSHLVVGLVFCGIALLWAIGAATGVDSPRPEIAAPAVLIGAGVIGLVATVANARRRRDEEAASRQAATESYLSETSTEEIR